MKRLAKAIALVMILGCLTACGSTKDSDMEVTEEQAELLNTEIEFTGEQQGVIATTEDKNSETVVEEAGSEAVNPVGEESDGNDSDLSYYGTWKIIRYYMPGITAMSKDEADGYVGMVLTYSTDAFVYNGNANDNPDYQEHELTAEEFASNYGGATFDSLGITSASVKQVDISNVDDLGWSFFVKDANTLLINKDGVFFEAEKQ